MKTENWPQIKQLYLDALERDKNERAAFLAQACAGDEALRHEVESLLGKQASAESFLEAPAADVAARLFDAQPPSAEPPTVPLPEKIGAYRILKRLGAGGMGEVYLAEDARLGRKIALKLLPAAFTSDRESVWRFTQEARAASALNHPNIITIFEVGQTESTHFIATEFIDGQTLRQQLKAGNIPLLEALDILVQTGSALAAAHEAGIFHRDIKPENLMLRRDGYVKVLDFGLAKLTETQLSQFATQMAGDVAMHTRSGVVMGTLAYMSPEQARGQKIDTRTDIFSLGVVSYELLTGERPFIGSTGAEIIAAVLHMEPPALTQVTPQLPAALSAVVSKMLNKERAQRYQTINEVLVELKALKRQLEFQAELARAGEEAATKAQAHTETPMETAGRLAGNTQAQHTAHATSAGELLLSELKRHKTGVALTMAALMLALGGFGFWLSRLMSQRQAPAPFQQMQISRLTATGNATDAAISPDGKYVVHVADETGRQSIWIKHIVTSSNTQIVLPTEARYSGLSFSPDGNYVYYVKTDRDKPVNALYQVPVLGGAPKKVTERIQGGVTFSPDGKRIAFARWNPMNFGQKLLIVMNADGSGERPLALSKMPEILVNSAWSPDGLMIACTVNNEASFDVKIVGVQVEDGTERLISTQKWSNVGRLAWLPDGSGLIVPASDKPINPPQLWYLAYPGGEVRRITNDLNGYNQVSLTADSKSLVTVQTDLVSNIWIAPAGDASHAKPITSGVGKYGAGVMTDPTGFNKLDVGGGLSWTPDGRIVYHSMVGGKLEIWMMDADGRNQKQLTAGAGSNFYPSVSPTGRYIVFESDRMGKANPWRMDIDGSNLKQLTDDNGALPSCSPDGKWVIYSVVAFPRLAALRKVSIDGGAPVQLTDSKESAHRSMVSPDGKLIAYNYIPAGSDWQLRIAVLPFTGGRPTKVFEILTINSLRELHWTANGQMVTYIETHQGVSNLWGQPLTGGQPLQLTNFKSDLIFSWDWSRDGKQLVVARGQQTSDVVLINDFK